MPSSDHKILKLNSDLKENRRKQVTGVIDERKMAKLFSIILFILANIPIIIFITLISMSQMKKYSDHSYALRNGSHLLKMFPAIS